MKPRQEIRSAFASRLLTNQIMKLSRRMFLGASSVMGVMAALPRALAQWQPSQRYPDPLIKIIDTQGVAGG